MRKLLFIFIFVSTNTFADEFATYLKCEPIEKKVVPIFREGFLNTCGPICKKQKQKQNLKPVGRTNDRTLGPYLTDDESWYLAPQNETVNFNTCGFHDTDEKGESTSQKIDSFDSDTYSLDLKRGAYCPSSKRMNTYSISDLLENKIKVNWEKVENDILQLNLRHEEKPLGSKYDLPMPKDVDFVIIKLSKTGSGFYWGASLKEKNPYQYRWNNDQRESWLGISKDFLADPDWEFPYSNKSTSHCSNKDMYYVTKNYRCSGQSLGDSPLTIDRKTLIYKRQFWSRTEFYQCVLSDKDTNTRIFKAYSEIEGKMSDLRIDDRAKKKREREELEELKERNEPNKI
jgi:hypothetical protein